MARKAGQDPEKTRARLIEAATAEFSEKGYQKASLRAICARAGVTTGALYFLFKNKQDLFETVVAPVLDEIPKRLSEHYAKQLASPNPDPLKDEEADLALAESLLDVFYDNAAVTHIVLENSTQSSIAACFDRTVDMIAGQAKRLLDQVYPDCEASTFFDAGTLHWYSHVQASLVVHVVRHKYTRDEADHQLKNMILFMRGGIGALLSRAQSE